VRIETVPIASLREDPGNARVHDAANIKAIKGSLEAFGQQKNIVVTADGVVVAGNGTLVAARELGWTEITVQRTSLEDEQVKAYALADNRAGELATWDQEILTSTLKHLDEHGIDVSKIGFEGFDFGIEPNDGLTDPDEIPEQVEPRTKPGDLWVLGEHRLLCGDSTNVQHVERLMGRETARICFTSPPYNIGKLNANGDVGQKYENDADDRDEGEYADFLAAFTSNMLTAARYVLVNLQLLAHNRVALSSYQHRFRGQLKDVLVWVKDTCAPNINRGTFGSRWEYVYVFASDADARTRCFDVPWQGKHFNVVEGPSAARENEFSDVHRATFPSYLPSWFVERLTSPGDLVVDPFCGTGTTLIACEKTGRRCFGMEIDAHYCDVIVARWEQFTGKTASLADNLDSN
jgi:DNA modification methylase